MTGAALTVPQNTDRDVGSTAVSTPTLMDSTPTLKKLVVRNTMYDIDGKIL